MRSPHERKVGQCSVLWSVCARHCDSVTVHSPVDTWNVGHPLCQKTHDVDTCCLCVVSATGSCIRSTQTVARPFTECRVRWLKLKVTRLLVQFLPAGPAVSSRRMSGSSFVLLRFLMVVIDLYTLMWWCNNGLIIAAVSRFQVAAVTIRVVHSRSPAWNTPTNESLNIYILAIKRQRNLICIVYFALNCHLWSLSFSSCLLIRVTVICYLYLVSLRGNHFTNYLFKSLNRSLLRLQSINEIDRCNLCSLLN